MNDAAKETKERGNENRCRRINFKNIKLAEEKYKENMIPEKKMMQYFHNFFIAGKIRYT